MTQEFKDKLTNYCGLVLAVCGAIIAVATAGVALPAWLLTVATVLGSISGALIGWATGKVVTPPKP